jgi:predicted nucleotidyltransferase
MNKAPKHIVQDENLKIIKEKILEIVPEARIILFGSRAGGTNREDSDYDLLRKIPEVLLNMKRKELSINIRRAIDFLEIPVDIMINSAEGYNYKIDLNYYMIKEVDTQGIYL